MVYLRVEDRPSFRTRITTCRCSLCRQVAPSNCPHTNALHVANYCMGAATAVCAWLSRLSGPDARRGWTLGALLAGAMLATWQALRQRQHARAHAHPGQQRGGAAAAAGDLSLDELLHGRYVVAE